MSENRCAACGGILPESSQVCVSCYAKARDKGFEEGTRLAETAACCAADEAANDGNYTLVSVADFRKMRESGEIFEATTYGHHHYGSRKTDVARILSQGKHVLTVMDICGAMAMKTHFPNVTTIYVKRDKKDLLTAILEKDAPTPDKVNRLLAIESETKNAQICDYTVKYDTCEQAVAQILQTLEIKE